MPTKRSAPPPPSDLDMRTDISAIPERMKQLRGEDLTDCQKAIISEFMAGKASPEAQKAFDKAFQIACVCEEEISKLETETSEARRSYLRKHIRRLETKITPAKKQRAIESRRPINAKCLEYFRQNGAPNNVRHFIKWLSEEGVLTRANKWDRPFKISETTVRHILHSTFGIKGTRGRKPG